MDCKATKQSVLFFCFFLIRASMVLLKQILSHRLSQIGAVKRKPLSPSSVVSLSWGSPRGAVNVTALNQFKQSSRNSCPPQSVFISGHPPTPHTHKSYGWGSPLPPWYPNPPRQATIPHKPDACIVIKGRCMMRWGTPCFLCVCV